MSIRLRIEAIAWARMAMSLSGRPWAARLKWRGSIIGTNTWQVAPWPATVDVSSTRITKVCVSVARRVIPAGRRFAESALWSWPVPF